MSGSQRPAESAAPISDAARETARDLVRRARTLVRTGTTELAPDLLSVPRWFYRDPTLAHRERTEVLARTPLALAATARLPHPHDYLVREVLGTSVLLTRDATGRARAFLNYCRHRGGRPAEGCGSARRFTCPYHAWTYDGAGRLVGGPDGPAFAGLVRDDHGLVALPTEERHGFVWVVLTAEAPIDVAAHLGPLDGELARWSFATAEHLTERTIYCPVDWKAALEAFAEDYHFATVHRSSIIGQHTVGDTATFDAFGPHHRLAFPSRWIVDAPDDVDTELAYLSLVYWVFPNLVLGVSGVGTEVIDILPGRTPGTCTIRHGWMATRPAADEATRAGYRDLYEQVHAAVRDEDGAVLAGCGDALAHAQHDHLLVGRNEPGVQSVVRSFARALGVDLTAPAAPGPPVG